MGIAVHKWCPVCRRTHIFIVEPRGVNTCKRIIKFDVSQEPLSDEGRRMFKIAQEVVRTESNRLPEEVEKCK